MGPQWQWFRVWRNGPNGTPVTDANVTVNGVRIPHDIAEVYWGEILDAVPVGGTLTLKVIAGGDTLEATVQVPAIPTITAPAAGQVFASTDSVAVTWSSLADPDRFDIDVNDNGPIYYLSGSARALNNPPGGVVHYGLGNELHWPPYSVPGSARAFKIPAGVVTDYPAGNIVSVTAIGDTFLKFSSSPKATSSVEFRVSSSVVVGLK